MNIDIGLCLVNIGKLQNHSEKVGRICRAHDVDVYHRPINSWYIQKTKPLTYKVWIM